MNRDTPPESPCAATAPRRKPRNFWPACGTGGLALALALPLMLGACAHHRTAAVAAPARSFAPPPNPGGRRPAPDFVLLGPGNRAIPSRQFRGQPVVILVAASPDSASLRKEADRIEHLYLDLSARKTVFVGAFTAGGGRVVSNVPFIIAENGAAVARAYGVAGREFAVVVIGVDGNVDMVSTQVEAAQRILDVINNNGSLQAANRVGLGS